MNVMEMFSLKGKVALVTGAGDRILDGAVGHNGNILTQLCAQFLLQGGDGLQSILTTIQVSADVLIHFVLLSASIEVDSSRPKQKFSIFPDFCPSAFLMMFHKKGLRR